MKKISNRDAREINKIFYDKVGQAIDRGYSRDVALRIAYEHIFKLWEEEKECESDCESD